MDTAINPFLLALYVFVNVATFVTFWLDKKAAINAERRIREDTLLLLAFFGGSLGAVLAQRSLRHKTRKQPFRTYLAAIACLHILSLACWLLVPTGVKTMVLTAIPGLQ